jgi:hypothetical protein
VRRPALYYLKYYEGGELKEILNYDNPRPENVIHWWEQQLRKQSMYKGGYFQMRRKQYEEDLI